MKKMFFAIAAFPIALAQTPADLDKRIAELRIRSIEEVNKYRESAGKPGGPGDPALAWAKTFWQFSEEHPGTTAATRAKGLALTWLRHADQDAEVLARAEALPPDHPVWATAIAGVRVSAKKTSEHERFRRLADSILSKAKEPGVRAAVSKAVGQSWLDQGKPEEAKRCFETAMREAPGTPAAKSAERELAALSRLAVGQPAPAFAARTIDGAPVALNDYRGKVIFLNVWASW
jgi:hypothetical protein